MKKKSLLIFGILAIGFNSSLSAQTINASQTDEIIIDNGASGKADPNDRIRYKVTIQNTAGPAGANTQLNIVPDPRTTFVAGTFRSSPLALNDAYACTGNVGLNVPAAFGLRANDFDDNIAGATITAGTFATIGGGSIVIAADGGFTYNPPAGLTGGSTDTYTYTLNDGNPVAGVTATDMATVTFTLNNLIWFVDNTGGGSGGNGTLSTPFKTLADFNGGSAAAGDVIYVENTGTNYTGGIVLQNNEDLYGEGHTGGANLSNVLPFGLAIHSKTLPAINGTRPLITNATGDGVTLASDNNLRGFDVGACSDFGIENSGTTSVGNLVVSEVSINNTTGGGFDASHGSGASTNAVFGSLSSTGGTNGINLNICAGTFTVNGGTITNPTGTGVLISGGSVVFSSNCTITDNTGNVIHIENHDSGNITFQTGNITSSAQGILVRLCNGGTIAFNNPSKSLNTGVNTAILLENNAGATINFGTSGLAITTTSGKGFDATGGGTVNVTGTGNTISSGTGTALNVANTTIGASGLNFQSISASGGPNGIVLNGSSGDLTVTGDGSGHANGSGGAITNITGGVLGNAPVYLLTASGTITLKSINMSLNTNCYSGMLVDNNAGGNITANLTGCTFIGVTSSVVQNKSLLQFEGGGSSNVTANVQNCYFSSNRTYGLFATAAGTSTMNVTLNQSGFGTDINMGAPVNNPGTNITNPPPFSVGITNGSSAQVDYVISNNTFWGADGLLGALYVVTISGATTLGGSHLNGTISGNKIGKAGVVGSGAANNSAGIGLLPGTGGTFQATVINNDIRQVNSFGINFKNSVSGAVGTSSVKIKGNTLAEPDVTGAPLFQRAIVVDPGNSGGANMTACAEIGGTLAGEPNIITGGWQAGNFIRVTNNNNTVALTLPGLSPATGATAAEVNAFVVTNNPTAAGAVNTSLGTAGIVDGAACF